MKCTFGLSRVAACIAVAAMGACAQAQADQTPIRHVLLISVDGLHAVDLERFISDPAHAQSTLTALSKSGVRYTAAATSRPSDSFPGLLSLVTGGSPASADVFYDVSWDRAQWAPAPTAPADCVALNVAAAPGNQTTYDETIDLLIMDPVSGLAIDQNTIDATRLPWGIKNGSCRRIYPHDFVKVNTIFEVIHGHHGRTAWADKHAAYDLVQGHNGDGVDDLYTPEVTNPQTLGSLSGPYDGDYGVVNGVATPDATVSVNCTLDNDKRKFDALVHEVNGLDHTGSKHVGTPTLFGTNLQAISVGQKVSHNNTDGSCNAPDPANLNGKPGGYVDGSGTPTAVLEYALEQTDLALGRVVAALKARHLYESTLIIITAKHGQAPIDPLLVNPPGLPTNKIGGLQTLVANSPRASDAAAQAIVNAGENEDDVAMIWLQNQGEAPAAAQWLRDNNVAGGLHIQQVLSGDLLKLRFRDPATDSHTPDIIVVPEVGTIYTTSGKKNAEHGGFSNDDTNVALIVSHPALQETVVQSAVLTTQVAPTILRSLGIDPMELEAVQQEHTAVLPDLGM